MQRLGIHLWNFLVAASVLLLLCSNAAQPGIWGAGGGGFNFLYPEDSTAFRKIQMQSESIAIQLYPGFAVIKGTYRMLNTTSDTIRIKVGYPVEGIYEGDGMMRNEIVFDSLSKLKVMQNGKIQPIIEEPLYVDKGQAETFHNDNWYIWESLFLPDTLTTLSVYFMVKTNDAEIRQGYSGNDHNAFIYILESGRIWKQPIEEATFKLQLKGGLEIDQIHGIAPNIDFDYSEGTKLFFGTKSTFTPLPQDNIVINYGELIEAFDFGEEVAASPEYFNAIDQLDEMEMSVLTFEEYDETDPYELKGIDWASWLFIFIFLLLPVLLFTAFVYLIVRLFNKWRNKKK